MNPMAERSGSIDGILTQTADLQNGTDDEERNIDRVTASEAAWLGAEAEEPFEAVSLHPERRLFDLAAVKIEGRTDPQHNLRVQLGAELGHETLLLRRAYTDPEKIRARR